MATRDIFLGRQPIVAYELLFRGGNTSGATVTDDMQATASVIHHAFSEMGVQTVLESLETIRIKRMNHPRTGCPERQA